MWRFGENVSGASFWRFCEHACRQQDDAHTTHVKMCLFFAHARATPRRKFKINRNLGRKMKRPKYYSVTCHVPVPVRRRNSSFWLVHRNVNNVERSTLGTAFVSTFIHFLSACDCGRMECITTFAALSSFVRLTCSLGVFARSEKI
jgi:hypothetical protein